MMSATLFKNKAVKFAMLNFTSTWSTHASTFPNMSRLPVTLQEHSFILLLKNLVTNSTSVLRETAKLNYELLVFISSNAVQRYLLE